jgi:hypothetical protein
VAPVLAGLRLHRVSTAVKMDSETWRMKEGYLGEPGQNYGFISSYFVLFARRVDVTCTKPDLFRSDHA